MSDAWAEMSLGYLQDLEEAHQRGVLPSREKFQALLGLELELRVRVDYDLSIRELLSTFSNSLVIEEEVEESDIYAERVGPGSGLRMVNMRPVDPGKLLSVDDFESVLPPGQKYATLGEGLHFLKRNHGSRALGPLIMVHQFSSGRRMAVFVGSRSGGEVSAVRFRPRDLKWKGCRHLIVSP